MKQQVFNNRTKTEAASKRKKFKQQKLRQLMRRVLPLFLAVETKTFFILKRQNPQILTSNVYEISSAVLGLHGIPFMVMDDP